MSEWPIDPKPDPDTAPFWAELAQGRLTARHCSSCDHLWLYPRSICPACGSADLDWHVLSGRGTVWAVTTNMRGLGPAFHARAPYTIAIVRLDEGPQLLATLCDGPPAPIGTAVRLEVARSGTGAPLPTFTPDGSST
jgi:uncharacterized OB-fold protein